MKKIMLFFAAAIAVGMGALLLSPAGEAGGAPVNAVYAADNAGGEITVNGTGTVNVNPDVAYISLGVNTVGRDPKTVLEENNQLIAKVIGTLRGLGIADRDIRTTDFNMYPRYDYSVVAKDDTERITGYTVSNNVSVVIRDIATVGSVLGAAADAGANVSGGVQFGLLDNSAAYNEALVLAIENAAGKAKAVAGALGKAIGSPSSVTESGGYAAPFTAREANFAVSDSAGSVPVQSGKLTVTANVQMVYAYTR